MRSSRLRRRAGWTLIGLSLLLHLLTIFAYSRQPDWIAAFTVLPIWIWGGLGLVLSVAAYWFLRAPLSLIITGIWAMTVLLGADEARVLISDTASSPPRPRVIGNAADLSRIRVITLNCNYFSYGGNNSDPTQDLRRWDPDIVLLQEVHPHHVRRISDVLHGGFGDYRIYSTNGVVSRWEIRREVNPNTAGMRLQQVTLRLPDQSEIEVVNVHLQSAVADFRLWRPAVWKAHRENRQARRRELAVALTILADTGGGRRTIFGGDFNAPASDATADLLKPDFEDAFLRAGNGWGNTYQRRVPVYRIDRIHYTPHFTALGCSVVTTRHSDHRMVVTDLTTAH